MMLKLRIKIARLILPEQIAVVHRGMMREAMRCNYSSFMAKSVIERIEERTATEWQFRAYKAPHY